MSKRKLKADISPDMIRRGYPVSYYYELPPRKEIPGHEECPRCHHMTLPPIKKNSHATGRMCNFCKAVVDREGNLEK